MINSTFTSGVSRRNKLTSVFKFLSILILMLLVSGKSWAATPYVMSTANYSEGFSDITNWTNNFAAGTGASCWASVGIIGSGTSVTSGVRTTKTSATFSTSTSGGVQKGTQALMFLSTGSGTTPEACAVDLLLDFTNRNAGVLSFDWAAIDNASGTRPTSLRIFWSTDGSTFTEITAAQVLDQVSPTSSSISTVSLPTQFNNCATARLRFYNHAGTVTGSGNRDKFQIDNVSVTSTAAVSTYTVNYNANGGSGTMTDGSSPYTSGVDVTVMTNTFTKAGYTFAGWATTAGGAVAYANGATISAIAANTTLYAKWTANSNTITFNGNGFTGGSTTAQIIATDVSANLTTNGFTKTGYTFAGWATAADGAVAYADGVSYAMGTGNVTLYAKWTANNNSITFDGNGSTSGSMSAQTIATDASANLTTNAYTKTGYSFSGWNTASDGTGTSYANGVSYTMGVSNVTFYAQWTIVLAPTISVIGSLSAVPTTYGTASSATSFSVSGSALTERILISPPAGYEVSQTSGGASGYAATQTLAIDGGLVGSTNIYVRLAATTIPSNCSGNVVLTSSGATTQNVATVLSTVSTKQLNISGLSIATAKVYDGTTSAAVSGTPSLLSTIASGSSVSNDGKPITSDDVSLTGTASGIYNSKDVASATTASVTGLSLAGAQSAYYTLNQGSAAATITAKNLTMSGLSVPASKTYDGTTTAVVSGTATLQTSEAVGAGSISDGIPYSGDEVSITGTATGTYDDANVASATTVTYGGLSLTGAEAGNYSFTIQSPQAATITKADQTITFGALASKTTASADFSPGATSASSATNPITYISSNESVATIVTVSPNVYNIHIVGAGNTNITASQAASANYNAAVDVVQGLTVNLVPVDILTFDFVGLTGTEVSANSNTKDANLYVSSISRGAGLTSGANADRFNATNWAVTSIANAISGNNYVEFTVSPNTGYMFSVSSILFQIQRSGTGISALALRNSIDNYANNLDVEKSVVDNTSTQSFTFTFNQINSLVPVTYRLYGYAEAASGTGGPGDGTGNDIVVKGNISVPVNPPTLTADASANTVDNNIDIPFTNDATWFSKVTAVKIGSTTLTPTTDYVLTAGNLQLIPSGLNALLITSGSKDVKILATGYADATVTQVINAGVPTTNSTASVSAPLAPNTVCNITCTAKDQYNNLVEGYSFKYDAAIVSADATTLESYTLDGTARTATASDVNVANVTNASGVATFAAALPTDFDTSDGISIQVQLNNGTTNIGSAFAYHALPTQTINFAALDAVTYGDAPYVISATGGGSGNPVVFTSSNTAVATCTGTNGATITVVGPGTSTIHANQAGNSSFNAAIQVDRTLTVNTKALTIVDVAATGKVYDGNATATITGTLSSRVGSDVVTLNLSGIYADETVADGKAVTSTSTLVGADEAKYTLTQPTGLTANIIQATQIINFGVLSNRIIGSGNFNLTATATSLLPVSYASTNEAVATVLGNVVTIVGIGSTNIIAVQGGNINFSAAPAVMRTLVVTAVPIAAWNFTGPGNYTSHAASIFSTDLVSTSNANEITRGAAAAYNVAANSFRTSGFKDDGISTSNTDYFQVTLTPVSGKSISLSTIDANFAGTSSFLVSPGVTSQFAYSLNGTDFTLIGSPVQSTSTAMAQVDLSTVAPLQNVAAGTTITLRYYASGQTTTGGWGFYSSAAGVNGLSIGGAVFTNISGSTTASTMSDCPTCNVEVAGNNTSLTVDVPKVVNSLTLSPRTNLILTSSLDVRGDLTFSADESGSFNAKVDAPVTMAAGSKVKFVKTMLDSKWYFMSFPCAVKVNEITQVFGAGTLGTLNTNWFIKYYNGQTRATNRGGANWVAITNPNAVLAPNQGYIFGLETGAGTKKLSFVLDNAIVTSAETVARNKVAMKIYDATAGVHGGWNLVGQPFLSTYSGAGKISGINFMQIPDAINGRTYSPVTSDDASLNPFAAYFIQAPSDGDIIFALDGRSGAPASVATSLIDKVKLVLTTSTGSDNTNLILDDTQSPDYQLGQDLEKWIGTDTDKPQVYTMLGGVNYAFNALPIANVVNLPLGVYTKNASSTTISLGAGSAPGLSKLLLTDTKTIPVTVTDLMTTNYTYNATSGTDNNRFLITAQRVATEIDNTLIDNNGITFIMMNGKLLFNNINGNTSIRVYDAIGRQIVSTTTRSTSFDVSLKAKGVYTIQYEFNGKYYTKKMINY
jgi:uncharacterized repeat protein (TIGR02543 family)